MSHVSISTCLYNESCLYIKSRPWHTFRSHASIRSHVSISTPWIMTLVPRRNESRLYHESCLHIKLMGHVSISSSWLMTHGTWLWHALTYIRVWVMTHVWGVMSHGSWIHRWISYYFTVIIEELFYCNYFFHQEILKYSSTILLHIFMSHDTFWRLMTHVMKHSQVLKYYITSCLKYSSTILLLY